ncbi:probable nucleoredoxin 1-1 [Copidosoma floridanum]|uniref:probable nucleoredoxin 1-1 n=1 Tax=Copidosoma floridanum TaxID=29053 RepID=UPI0006C9624C|nr:probable nucleoredoxin 1-1 [Copidosoma floridanum]
MEILKGNFLVNANEETVIANEIIRSSEMIGLYFSASWCPPCRSLLPLLKATYKEARSRGAKLEVVFVPSDSDDQQMMRFFVDNHGPWFAVPVGPLTAAVRRKMQIHAIPQLVVVNNRGEVVRRNGRADLEGHEDPLSLWFPRLNRGAAGEN